MEPAIVADKLSKRYELGQLHQNNMLRETLLSVLRGKRRAKQEASHLWALRDVSFEVAEGDVVGIIGRNGAGKSTLLKVLSKITFPTSGRLKTRGRVASLLEVGTGFHEELTGRENVYLNGSILGMKKREIDAKLDAIVAFADVEKFLDTPIKRYSSGMRLRLGFAVAAHLEPDVLMVDEVLAVGDVGFQKKCLQAMDDLHSGGRTVLFVSHNLAAVENLCPRTIWIDGGKVREDGPSESVLQSYLATFADPRSHNADLRDFEHRKGSGEIRYTKLEFLDDDLEPLAVIRSGDTVVFRLHYQATQTIAEPHFGIEVHTNLGTLLTSFNTWTAGYNVREILPGDGYVDVRVQGLNLSPDRYYLSLWLSGVGAKYDRLELCSSLDVEPADVHESGRSLDQCFGHVFFPCQWSQPVPASGAGAK